ncbi:MAG: glycosyltransferase [Marinilabilia sp.]
MIFIILFTGLITGLYAFLILSFSKGWENIPEISTHHRTRERVFISVIIPFRNECHNLKELIENITQQSFSTHHLEVVMVDDHSRDQGPEHLEQLQKSHHWLKVVESEGAGKKEALRHGISTATGELVITTDADCRFGKDWLQTIAEAYLDSSPDMLVMPVSMDTGRNKLSRFQQIEYLALQMTTAGAFGIGKPFLCSGANLAFRKKSFLEAARFAKGRQYLSGDDVFLLQAFKKQNFRIKYLRSPQAMVKTTPAPSLRDFFVQRMRWSGKSPAYQDNFARQTALLILLTNAWAAILPFLSAISTIFAAVWAAMMIIKAVVDRKLLNAGNRFFSVRIKAGNFIVFSLLYPFYALITGLGSLLFKEKWKERTGK